MAHQCEQQRSCPQDLTVASRRFPLRERRNPPSLLPSPPSKQRCLSNSLKSIPPSKISLFPFPCSTDPVPDAPIDYNELWNAVSMSKQADEDNSKASAKGTEVYADILYRLGVDIEFGNVGKPEDVIDLNHYPLPPTMEYPNLGTDKQLQESANKHKRYTKGLNEATIAAFLMRHIFISDDVPDFDAKERSTVLCQILEFRSAFTGFDRFNKDFYTFVRGPKRERTSPPHEGNLRFRSDLTYMAYANAIGRRFRRACIDQPGAYKEYYAIAPFLSIEFKVDDNLAKVREATHQIAISSFVSLVERQRLPRNPSKLSYTKDENMRHYGYTICGNEISVWMTTLRPENKNRQWYNTYKVQRLAQLNLAQEDDLKEFLQWHRCIITWGLRVYVTDYVDDVEACLGVLRRESLVRLIQSSKMVTRSVDSKEILERLGLEELGEDEELDDEAEDSATENLATEEGAMTENPETDDGPVGRQAKDKATEYASPSKLARNRPSWLMNAISSSSMTDCAMVREYLTKLLEHITELKEGIVSFIKQLDEEAVNISTTQAQSGTSAQGSSTPTASGVLAQASSISTSQAQNPTSTLESSTSTTQAQSGIAAQGSSMLTTQAQNPTSAQRPNTSATQAQNRKNVSLRPRPPWKA